MSRTKNLVEYFPFTNNAERKLSVAFPVRSVLLPLEPSPIVKSHSSVDFWLPINVELKTYFPVYDVAVPLEKQQATNGSVT